MDVTSKRPRYGVYDVVERLGSGGTGVVLLCVHRESGATVALKTPKDDRRKSREALRREAAALRRLGRSNVRGVVRVLDQGLEEGDPWYAMEFLQRNSLRYMFTRLWQDFPRSAGGAASKIEPTLSASYIVGREFESNASASADHLVRSHPDPSQKPPAAAGELSRVLRVLLRLAEILARIHGEGVVHGDLTPENVVFRDEGDPVLIDFGAALVEVEPEAWRERPLAETRGVGTPGYLAPERISGEPLDARCDLYSLGCIAYELVSGVRAFAASSERDTLRKHLGYRPPPLSAVVDAVPTALEELTLGLIERDPLSRISRAEDVCRALSSLLGEQLSTRSLPRTATLFRPLLRGRSEEFARMRQALEGVRDGKGGLALVSGPTGIGKTRFMNELAAAASRLGLPVVWCRAEGAPTPGNNDLIHAAGLALFEPVVQLALDTTPDGAEVERDASLPPTLHRVLGDLAEGDAEQVTRRALAALSNLIGEVAHTKGLVILVDDLQWADELSLRFLDQHAAQLSEMGALVIAGYRSDEASPAVEQLEQRAIAGVSLDALEPSDIRAMLKDLLGTLSLPEALLDFLIQRTDGNPLFVVEYVRAAMAGKVLRRDEHGSWQFAHRGLADPGAFAVPESIDGLLRARASQLTPHGRAGLELACVLGREFDYMVFAGVLNRQLAAMEVLDELVGSDILLTPEPGRYRFANDALRQALLGGLSDAQRRTYHAEAARFLESLSQRVEPALLGYHLGAAGDSARAAPYLEEAAATARAAQALQRAAELYRMCLRHYQALPPSQGVLEKLVQLYEVLADVLVTRAAHSEARECLTALLTMEGAATHVTLARARRKLGASFWTLHEYEAAAVELEAAEALLERARIAGELDWFEWIQVKLGRFEQLYFSGKIGPELDTLVEQLAGLVDQHGSAEQRCVYYQTAASHAFLKNRYAFEAQALVLAEKGLASAGGLPKHRVALARFIHSCALMLGTRSDCSSAVQGFEQAVADAAAAGETTLIARIRIYQAINLLRTGDVDATERVALQALEAADSARLLPYVAAAQACQGWAAWRRDDTQAAERLLNAARRFWNEHPHKFPFTNIAVFPLLAIAETRDDFTAMRVLLKELERGLPALPPPLCTAIDAALAALDAGTDRAASDATLRVTRLARELAFT